MGQVLLPIGTWVFLAMSTNTNAQVQNGFRYTLPSTSTQTLVYGSRSPTSGGVFYDLASNGTYFLGGDTWLGDAGNVVLQYVRLYVDYFSNSNNEMINLASLDSGN